VTATLTLTLTEEEANVLAQALDLLASDPSRTAVRPLTSAEWPNIEVSRTADDNPKLAALGYAAFNVSSRVHDPVNTTATSSGRGIDSAVNEATSAAAPSWTEGLRVAMGR
jgi:hypothetical protein